MTAVPRRGFTLAELLTVLVVIAVLTAIAVPTWKNHALRTRRADARATLVALSSAQEAYFARHARYADRLALGTPPPDGLGLGATSEHGFYDIELVTSEDALGFTATARPRRRALVDQDPRCNSFRVDHHGTRRAENADGVDTTEICWH